MFSDIQYLRIYVSKDEPWDAIIKQLYSKRLSKSDVKARIAYTIVNGKRGKIQEGKGDMWLSAGNTFASYTMENWEALYEEIKESDRQIVAIRKRLSAIPYIEPIMHPEWSLFSCNYLKDSWNIPSPVSYEEIKMYGINAIERLIRSGHYNYPTKKGRYHFTQAIHNFARSQGLDLVELKKYDSIRFKNLLRDNENSSSQQNSIPVRENLVQGND